MIIKWSNIRNAGRCMDSGCEYGTTPKRRHVRMDAEVVCFTVDRMTVSLCPAHARVLALQLDVLLKDAPLAMNKGGSK